MNRNGEPVIRPIASAAEFRKLVDVLITPETADAEAKAFVDILTTVANPDDERSYVLAMDAARHAFLKTEAFERAFREFTGWPDRTSVNADHYFVHAAGKEM